MEQEQKKPKVMKTKTMPAPREKKVTTQNIASSFSLMKGITFGMLALLIITILGSFFLIKNINDENQKRAFFVTNMATGTGVSVLTNEQRLVEVRNHIRLFVNHMFAFDQGNFVKNVGYALNLIGSQGKDMYNDYKKQNTLYTLKTSNAKIFVEIDSLVLVNDVEPYRYKLYARQTAKTSQGIMQTFLWTNIELSDVARTDSVPTGLVIDKFDTYKNDQVPRSIIEDELSSGKYN